MKRFILKIFLFVVLFTGLMATIAVADKRYFFTDNYLNEFPVKKQLLRTTPSPRVVVIGGSNVAFGIDSKALSDSLGMPVVNAGLHAGLGLRYILHANTPLLRRGDILVIMPEYGHFFNTTAWGNTITLGLAPFFATAEEMCDFNGHQLEVVARGFSHMALQTFLTGIKEKIRPQKESSTFLYLKSGFDSHGDEVSHLVKQTDRDMTQYKCSPSFTAFNEEYLAEFISAVHNMEQKGIRVILLPPAILDSELAADRTMIDSLAHRLQTAGIPFRASLDTFAYPARYLYNSTYHLNAEGVRKNTENIRVIRAIRVQKK